jgi:hypothetical protein
MALHRRPGGSQVNVGLLRHALLGGAALAAAFSADFTVLTSLPSWVSFSRASNAMVTDSTGKLTYGPNNFFTQSNNFSDAAWQKSGTASVTGGFADPVGGSSATRLDLPAVNDFISQFVNPFPSPKGIHSVWVRSDSPGTIHLNDGSGGGWNVSVSVGTTWALVDTGPQVQASSAVRIIRVSGDLASLYIYNQVLAAVTYETSARSADQVITTSLPYYGPRFDHAWNGSAWVATGLMDERQRTNLTLQSNNPSDAAWTKDSGGSINATNRPAPDGTNTASTFTTSSNGGRLYQSYVSTSGQPYSLSRWIRRRTGSGTVKIWNQSNVEVDITSQVSSVWNRISFTDTSSGTGFNMLILGTAGDEIDIYGAQSELGPNATSYIPTTSAAVTRNADNVQLTGAALTAAASAAVSFFIETDSVKNIVGNQRVLGLNGSSGPGIFISADNTVGTYSNAFVLTSTIGSAGTYSGGIVRSASCGDGSGRSVVANGGTVATDANVLSTAPITAVYLGSDSATNIDGWIRSLAIYTSRLSDADLQAKSVVGASL